MAERYREQYPYRQEEDRGRDQGYESRHRGSASDEGDWMRQRGFEYGAGQQRGQGDYDERSRHSAASQQAGYAPWERSQQGSRDWQESGRGGYGSQGSYDESYGGGMSHGHTGPHYGQGGQGGQGSYGQSGQSGGGQGGYGGYGQAGQGGYGSGSQGGGWQQGGYGGGRTGGWQGGQGGEQDWQRGSSGGVGASGQYGGSQRGGQDWQRASSGGSYGTGGSYGGRDYLDEGRVQFGRGGGSESDWSGAYSQYGRQGQGGTMGGYGQQMHRQKRGPKDYQRTDERIREDLCERLWQSHHIDAQDVSVQVKDGKVTLDGTVPDRHMKHAIEDMADECWGVKDVENRIRVSSPDSSMSQSGREQSDSSASTTSGQQSGAGSSGSAGQSATSGQTGSSGYGAGSSTGSTSGSSSSTGMTHTGATGSGSQTKK